MEKVRIDTEVRRLDMLRAAHLNQQYETGREVRKLPGRIEHSRKWHAGLLEDIATRDAHSGEKFVMTVNGKEFSGKNAREEAGKALIAAITSSLWEGSRELKLCGHYRGFEILSRGSPFKDGVPELYLRGHHTYAANLNPENALGTVASIEYALRRLDRDAEDEQSKCERMEKALADYREQLGRPFEHETRLRELLLQQQGINKQLDLDKGDSQVVANDNTPQEEESPGTFVERLEARRIKRGQTSNFEGVA